MAENAASSPNAAFSEDPGFSTQKFLATKSFIVDGAAQLKFRHKLDLDATPGSAVTFDAMQLEISFRDPDLSRFDEFLACGGTFVSGGYNHLVFSGAGNLIAGQLAWGGATQGYVDVVATLPILHGPRSVSLRWRMYMDQFPGGSGYWLDDVRVESVPEYIFRGEFDGPNPCSEN